MRISYLGPPGTFTEEALKTQDDLGAGDLLPVRAVPDAVAAVESGDADAAFVPIENSIEGSVTVTLDTLAFESELLIRREVDLPVSFSLCMKPETTMRQITTVRSIPIAAAQCRQWLRRRVPKAEIEPATSTADAARAVARSRKAGQAAIANPLAAQLYGLREAATAIEDHPHNSTRFVLVGRGVPEPTGHDRTSVVCFQRKNRPGSLLGILQEFSARAIDLTKLESRPTKSGLGEYCFFIDLEGHIADEVVADTLRDLAAKIAEVKFLGSYPVGGQGEGEAVVRRSAAGKAWREADAWMRGLRAQIDGDGPSDERIAQTEESR
ncbi:MAG: prephenate dehydratase [Acidimicrobiia bacterium]|nr:prephenate dehydratase [Acidimicrobiia bacterium]